MKIITTLIGIMGFQYISLCQPAASAAQQTATTVCTVDYSDESEALQPLEAAPVKSREIMIVGLPPFTHASIPVNLEFGMTGAFTFKKDPSLDVNSSFDLYIEDMLTGQIFNLKTNNSYSFKVSHKVPGRFVLHIDNLLNRYAAK